MQFIPGRGCGQCEGGIGDGADGGKEAGGVLQPREAREVIVHGRAEDAGWEGEARICGRCRPFAADAFSHFNLAPPSNQPAIPGMLSAAAAR